MQLRLPVELKPTPTSYLRGYTCEDCGRLDTSGTQGPPMLWGVPGAYGSAADCWFCATCSARLWGRYIQAKTRGPIRRVRWWAA